MILVRHAPTASNDSSIYMGGLDIPATGEGLAESHDQAAAIRALGPFRLAVSSPLARAVQTLDAIRPDNVEYLLDKRLSERRLGTWEGKEKASLQRDYPEAFLPSGVLDARYAFESGESLPEFATRVEEFLADYVHENVLVVTHNGWIRTARYLCGEISRDDIFSESEPHNRALTLAGRVGTVI